IAFLSACETAVGDTRTPNEVIHLAAGLQFAGVSLRHSGMWTVAPCDALSSRLTKISLGTAR
ncbi:hypothetical protein EDB19DRAFT_1639472, partial [Suillus lakei]